MHSPCSSHDKSSCPAYTPTTHAQHACQVITLQWPSCDIALLISMTAVHQTHRSSMVVQCREQAAQQRCLNCKRVAKQDAPWTPSCGDKNTHSGTVAPPLTSALQHWNPDVNTSKWRNGAENARGSGESGFEAHLLAHLLLCTGPKYSQQSDKYERAV